MDFKPAPELAGSLAHAHNAHAKLRAFLNTRATGLHGHPVTFVLYFQFHPGWAPREPYPGDRTLGVTVDVSKAFLYDAKKSCLNLLG